MKLEILLVEDYSHPIEKVWAAITDPAALAQWLMVNDFEPRIGKRFALRAEPTAEWRGWMDCEVLEMEPPRRMVWSWHRSELDGLTRVEFQLEPIAGGTRLTLMHTGEADSMARGRYSSGWPIKLNNLGSLLAKNRLVSSATKTITEQSLMQNHKVVSHEEWLAVRKQFLAKEREFTRLRDQLSKERRELPWERVDKNYVFAGSGGKETLSQLFEGRSQLVVYHFMFDPDWDAGCPHCSFWADNFNGIPVHLKHRDVTMVAISRAPQAKLEAYRKRMGWSFKWLSSFGSDFNYDYYVSFTPEEVAKEQAYYNYRLNKRQKGLESVGISVFHKDADGTVFHTYSCYSRGVDMLNGAYHYLDLVPKGRDEAGDNNPQFWVRRHDEYED